MSAIIYNRQGYRIFTTPINKGSKAKFTLMQEDYVTLHFSEVAPMKFNLGDYFDYAHNGKRYEVIDIVTPKANTSTGGYDYELRLDAYYWKWRNKIFKYFNSSDSTSKETAWQITSTPDVVLGILVRNLTDYGYIYYTGGQPFIYDLSTLDNANEAKALSFNATNLIDALNAIAEAWECEWWVTENIIHIGKCEFGDTYVPLHTTAYNGNKSNVEEMSQSGNRTTYATRIFAYGSERNVPSNYRETDSTDVTNAVVQKRLMLPEDTPYVDAYRYNSDYSQRIYIGEDGYDNAPNEMPEEEAVEGSVAFDKVYPKMEDAISKIQTDTITDTIENEDGTTTTETWTRYRIQLDSSKLSANYFKSSYLFQGVTLRISFESGLLNGMDFDVTFNPEAKSETSIDSQWFEIVRNEDYGRQLPDDTLAPAVGDKVVLYNWDIASMATDELGYIAKAEQELLSEAKKYVVKTMIDPNNYNCRMMSDVMLGYDLNTHTANEDNALSLEIGQRVLLINSVFFDAGERKSRIIGYEYNLDLPWDSPTYVVGETASVGRLSAMESKIEQLTLKGIASSNATGNVIYIIGSNDITKSTDRNVYSALRTDKNFARKDKTDLIQEVWKFYKYLQSKDFNSGVLGYGWFLGYDQFDANGNGTNSHLEIDSLKVRKKTMFDSLEIKHVAHVGGELILSPAGATISKIQSGSVAYRCFFRNDDGTDVIANQFSEGDLVMCKTFNVESGQRYYWRRCVGVGTSTDGMAYVDLSLSMYDRTSINDLPAVGDVIVTVGNATDTARRNAIVISSYATGAPSISMYQGISTYSLTDDIMPVRISPTLGNKFTGEFYIQILADDGTQQVMALAEFLEDRISLGVNSVVYEKECATNTNPNAHTDLYSIDLNDYAKEWKKGDIIDVEVGVRAHNQGGIDISIYGEEATGSTLSSLNGNYGFRLYDPSGENYDTTLYISFIMDMDWKENFNGYGYAYYVFEASEAVEIYSVSVKKRSLQGELKRTGIDIENGYITLDAQTTTIKDGDKEIAVFTTNADGKAILSTELIDADEIAVNKLTTKGVVSSGKRTKFIDINTGQMTAFDENGSPKVLIHSGNIQSDSTSASVLFSYLGSINTLLSANNNLKINISNVFSVTDETMLFVFNAITGTMTLNLREYTSSEPAPQSVIVKARLYYAESESSAMEAIEVLAEQTFSLFGVNVPSVQVLNLELNIDNHIFAKGFYKIVLDINIPAPHNDSTITISANSSGVRGTKSTQMQEIATNGYHFSYGDNTNQKYQKASADNFEVMFTPFGLRISSNGIQITKNNGSTWINL